MKLIIVFLCLAIYAESKNVLVLLADDAGFEMGAYLNKEILTPNLDKLAKRSTLFNNANTAVSSCSPSRASILTGQPSYENGMYGLHHGIHHFNSFNKIKSIPNVLSKFGIKTGIVGKKHVGPEDVYHFDFSKTEEDMPILQIGRNVTYMKLMVRKFLKSYGKKPFFLYVGFHDPHRCRQHPEYGKFCEKFGNGEPGNGVIPDWTPVIYTSTTLDVPYFVPDTVISREELSAQYTTISRLDTGIGLIIQELKHAGVLDDTLIIYTSDNGIPFPAGRTNLYNSGTLVPLLVSSPRAIEKRKVSKDPVSLLDIVPTILDWFNITNECKTPSDLCLKLYGQSLLPIVEKADGVQRLDRYYVYTSHNLHEVTMYYPMRAVKFLNQYKLIHNLNYKMPFPIDIDLALSDTFQELLSNTRAQVPTNWYRTLKDYYYRPEWEFYDLRADPEETRNLYNDSDSQFRIREMKSFLSHYTNKTEDPWFCSPSGILISPNNCLPLDNDLSYLV